MFIRISAVGVGSLRAPPHRRATRTQRCVSLCEPSVNGAGALRQRKPGRRRPADDASVVNAPLHRQLLSLVPLDAAAAEALRAMARTLQRAETAPLAGKNIALMCGAETSDAELALAEAAMGLGARVARIEPAQPEAGRARLIEHLYDAVDCEALPPGFAQELQDRVSVPVFDGLTRDDHPIFLLVDGTLDRRALVQAALVSTLL
jgi:ornithine carbamoyltransferase